MAQYKRRIKQPASVDVQACSWAGVQEAIKVAALGEGSDDESNMAKRSCSKMARNIPDFETWLNLLPDGDYGAVVCGVFRMVVVVGTFSTLQTIHPYYFRQQNVQTTYGYPSSRHWQRYPNLLQGQWSIERCTKTPSLRSSSRRLRSFAKLC